MRDVLEQTRLLGEAILNSDIYKRTQAAENQVTTDPAASRAISEYITGKQRVQELLGAEGGVNAEALAEAARELEEAEKRMDEVPLVIEMREARKAYADMMNSVNQLLQLMLGGSSESSCSGDCGSCGGCH